MEKNIYEKSAKHFEKNGQDLEKLEKEFLEIGIKAFKTLDLKEGDIIAMQPREEIDRHRWTRIMTAMNATQQVLGIRVNFLVIPYDFELKILRPAGD